MIALHQTKTIVRKRSAQREISNYLKDVWRTGSLSPTNPLLTALQDNEIPPLPSTIQPYHVVPAMTQIQQEAAAIDFSQTILQQMDAVQGKFDSLKQITSLFWLTSSSSPEWREALQAIHTNGRFTKEQQQGMYATLTNLMKTTKTDEQRHAASRWIRDYEQQTGAHLANNDEYQMLVEALEEIEAKFQVDYKTLSPAQTKQIMGDMYNYLGIQGRLAELLGYTHHAERTLQHRMADIPQIHRLHEQVTDRVMSLVTKGLTNTTHTVLDEYLSSSTNRAPTPQEDASRKDKATMLRLEQHVTLEGALEFTKKLSLELFGLVLVEDEHVVPGTMWDRDVRLFHVFNDIDHTKLGSFLLDPHSRNGKCTQPFTASLINRGTEHLPLVVLSMAVEPPAWDNESTPMRWNDVETLLHEMGHVYQLLASQSTLGTLLGAQHLTLDLSELLPKYMEHWMTEPSTIYTLMMLSKPSRTVVFENEDEMRESIDAALRVRSNDKALQLAQLCFFGELELSLFSSFDIRGDELLIHFQNRMATKFSPHDLPDKNDITPLLRIFRENADGRAVAWYRYLWCDVLSASIFHRSKAIYASKKDDNPLRGMMRRVILEPGVMMDPVEILREFEIDEMSPDALLKLYNL